MPFSTLEELERSLTDSKNPQATDILEFIRSAVENEKQTGITLKRKANSEAQNLRRWKTKLEELGYDGDDPEAIAEWLKQKAPPVKEGEPNPEIEKLRREFKKAQDALAEKTAEASKVKATSDSRAIKAKLTEALRDKVYGHDLLADTLISSGRVKLADDESVVFVNGEDELDFEKGVKRLLESRPDLLKNTQTPGAKSGNRSTSAAPRYTMDQLKTMSAEQIAADIDNVNASMRAMTT